MRQVPEGIHPQRFNRYRIIRTLGSGGMGVVHEAIHEDLGRHVALKVMRSPVTRPAAAARFLREARLAAQIRHPNVVDVFDVGVEEGVPFIVMELLEGESLASLLSRRRVLGTTEIVDLFLPLLSAVAAAHEVGTVHRDLKPGNVIMARRGRRRSRPQPVVLDFGISKMTNDESDGVVTGSDLLLGTVHYMAPEQTRGSKYADARSDQYSLGVMLYECATGTLPFSGESPYELMHAVVTAPVRPPRAIQADVDPKLEALVLRAMSKNPEKRFPSVDALAKELLWLGGKAAWSIWSHEFGTDADSGDSAGETINDETPSDVVARMRSAPDAASGLRTVQRRRFVRRVMSIVAVGAVSIAAVIASRRTPDLSAQGPDLPLDTTNERDLGPRQAVGSGLAKAIEVEKAGPALAEEASFDASSTRQAPAAVQGATAAKAGKKGPPPSYHAGRYPPSGAARSPAKEADSIPAPKTTSEPTPEMGANNALILP